jgi:hypothetical protein
MARITPPLHESHRLLRRRLRELDRHLRRLAGGDEPNARRVERHQMRVAIRLGVVGLGATPCGE